MEKEGEYERHVGREEGKKMDRQRVRKREREG